MKQAPCNILKIQSLNRHSPKLKELQSLVGEAGPWEQNYSTVNITWYVAGFMASPDYTAVYCQAP